MDYKTNTKKGYGKRPLWQWVVIYTIIGSVVYGGIYFFVISKRMAYGSNQTYTMPPTQSQQLPSSGY